MTARRASSFEVSAGESEDAGVRKTYEAVRELGVEEEAELLDGAGVRRRCDSPRFRSGVIFHDGATVQPARLVLALRRAAIAAGVLLCERTPVTRVAPLNKETEAVPTASVQTAPDASSSFQWLVSSGRYCSYSR